MGEAETGEDLKPVEERRKEIRLVGEAETGEESKASRGEEERNTED